MNLLGVGGAERHMVTLANSLCEEFRIVFVYIKSDSQLLEDLRVADLAGVFGLASRKGFDSVAIRKLQSIVEEHRPSVVICANTYALMFAQLARFRSKTRFAIVEVFHTTILQTLRQHAQMIAYRPMFWLADHLVYVSGAQLEYWRRRAVFARHVSVIHNGVNVEHFDPERFAEARKNVRRSHGFSEDDLVIGICAVMRPEKAHEDLLNAVANLQDAGCKALLIGDGPTRPEIEKTVARLSLESQVRITGFKSDVRGELAACDVVALVSVTETFSVAILEAMAMAKPIILSDVGGAREQICDGETGWLFPSRDVAALTQCLRDASRSRELLRTMGRRNRDRVIQKFSLATMIKQYSELLRTLIH